jgi:hypothetical protein
MQWAHFGMIAAVMGLCYSRARSATARAQCSSRAIVGPSSPWYSPPIQAMGHYDLVGGQLHRTQGPPDQPSPASAALYRALHPPAGAGPASRGHLTC